MLIIYYLKKTIISIKNIGFRLTLVKIKNLLHRTSHVSPLKKHLYLSKKEKSLQVNYVFQKNIKISIITPVYNTPKKFLIEMIESVIKQTYGNWELCLTNGSGAEHEYVKNICEKYAQEDKRIIYKKLEKNGGISENSNSAMELASGDYFALLDHDDILHPAALYEVMNVICNENADFIYTDEANFYNSSIFFRHHKPDYAPDYLCSCNYICHFTVFSRQLMEKAGKFNSMFDGSQDHDLFLRYTQNASKISHISKLLYFWRTHKKSTSFDVSVKPYAITASENALRKHLTDLNITGDVESIEKLPGLYRIKYAITGQPLISILIPNKDNISLLKNCINSIIEKSTYKNYEIIIIENNSTEESIFKYYEDLKKYSNIKVVFWEGKGFNHSALNNFGINYANGEHLIFLNNDIEIITPQWIDEMLMYCQRSDVGAAGNMLYYPNNKIQHAGVVLGLLGLAGHIYKNFPRGSNGYMGKLKTAQNMSAVTAACMMVKKSAFQEVGCFSEDFYEAFNDVDLCLKIRKAGYLIVWTPFSEAYHHESKTRSLPDTPEKVKEFDRIVDMFKNKWKKEMKAGDPYYNRNFSLNEFDYRLK